MGPGIPIEPPLILKIRLTGRDGRLWWNGVPLGGQVDDPDGWRTLEHYLQISGELEPMPFATLLFDRGTSCAAVDRARALMRHHLACERSGRCFQGAAPY